MPLNAEQLDTLARNFIQGSTPYTQQQLADLRAKELARFEKNPDSDKSLEELNLKIMAKADELRQLDQKLVAINTSRSIEEILLNNNYKHREYPFVRIKSHDHYMQRATEIIKTPLKETQASKDATVAAKFNYARQSHERLRQKTQPGYKEPSDLAEAQHLQNIDITIDAINTEFNNVMNTQLPYYERHVISELEVFINKYIFCNVTDPIDAQNDKLVIACGRIAVLKLLLARNIGKAGCFSTVQIVEFYGAALSVFHKVILDIPKIHGLNSFFICINKSITLINNYYKFQFLVNADHRSFGALEALILKDMNFFRADTQDADDDEEEAKNLPKSVSFIPMPAPIPDTLMYDTIEIDNPTNNQPEQSSVLNLAYLALGFVKPNPVTTTINTTSIATQQQAQYAAQANNNNTVQTANATFEPTQEAQQQETYKHKRDILNQLQGKPLQQDNYKKIKM